MRVKPYAFIGPQHETKGNKEISVLNTNLAKKLLKINKNIAKSPIFKRPIFGGARHKWVKKCHKIDQTPFFAKMQCPRMSFRLILYAIGAKTGGRLGGGLHCLPLTGSAEP